MTRLVLVVICAALAVACGGEKKSASPLEQARAAKAEVCACPTMACRANAQQRFMDALPRVTDPATQRALSAELAACLAKAPTDAWKEMLAEVCGCKTIECVTEAQEKATQLAAISDRATVVAQSAEIEKCLVTNDEGLKLLSDIRDRACACTDAACAAQARADLKAASKTPTKFMERSLQMGVEIVECLKKHE